jgi:D-serine deaminase-like pyridoxal phosphate-dependent protein
MDEFRMAGKVLGTVVSTPRRGIAIGDVGARAIALVAGLIPSLEGLPGVTVDSLMEEHVVLRSEADMPLEVGDHFTLIPGHQDSVVNRWDQFVAVRDGVVEGVWDIPGRGCFH